MIYEQGESYALTHAKGLGGTDLAAITGVSPWKRPIDVFVAKTEPHKVEPLDKECLFWGTALEPIIRDRYAIRFNCEIVAPIQIQNIFANHHIWNNQTIVVGEKDFMLGTPDGLMPQVKSGLEIKCSSMKSDEWGKPGSDEIPEHYFVQCMWYMAVCGYPAWNVAVLFSGNKLESYRIVRNDELIVELIKRAEWFWNDCVLKNNPPPVDESENYFRFLSRRYSIGNGQLVKQTPEIFELASTLKRVAAEQKELESREQFAKNVLADMFREADGCATELGKVAWVRPKESQVIDYRAAFYDLAGQLNKVKKYAKVTEKALADHTSTRQNSAYLRGWWKKENGDKQLNAGNPQS